MGKENNVVIESDVKSILVQGNISSIYFSVFSVNLNDKQQKIKTRC